MENEEVDVVVVEAKKKVYRMTREEALKMFKKLAEQKAVQMILKKDQIIIAPTDLFKCPTLKELILSLIDISYLKEKAHKLLNLINKIESLIMEAGEDASEIEEMLER